jgi:hypothetical protein
MRNQSLAWSGLFQFATVSTFAISLGACTVQPTTTEPVNAGSRISSLRILEVLSPMGAVQPNAGCQCSGTGPSGPVTVSCGQSACGSDLIVYSCDTAGWTYTGQACSGNGDAGICQCSGSGPGGFPITVNCGQSACGSDFTTYSCSATGWLGTGQSCTCSCSGTGPGGVPVTAYCGQSACGSDFTTYSCSATGWSGTGQSCNNNSDAGVPPSADAGATPDSGPCQCSGSGPGGYPVTANCGQSACGSDFMTYACSAAGWSGTSQSCTCSCSGTGPGGVPVTAYCGQSACGSDFTTYSCSATGWSGTGQSCNNNSDAGVPPSADAGATPDSSPCQCTGTGPGGTPVTVNCGQSACGSDLVTYTCSASGWSWTGLSCTGGGGGDAGADASESPDGSTPGVQVSAGGYHSCGVKADGSVTCWGSNDYGQTTPEAGDIHRGLRRRVPQLRRQEG